MGVAEKPQGDQKPQLIASTMVNPDKIQVREVQGFFQRLRAITLTVLFALFFLMEWVTWNGRQAILFDLPARQFHIFGITFWPQDFTLLALLLIIAAFLLFAVTNFAGRLWCGFTCPQTAWTFIYMWIEERLEGSRNQRIRLDRRGWSLDKILRRGTKHLLWLLVAFLTGFTFVSYFYPVRELIPDLLAGDVGAWPLFWMLFFTATTYGAAGFLREQLCFFWCPYARFQAVMFDLDTLLVSYDKRRGEGEKGRGSRKKGEDHKARGLGDCIDCDLCVQVCPVGIDIRDGIQYQCIDCGLCIDACDGVMEKMGYPPGLIRYTTERNLAGEKTHVLRPRLFGYSFMVLVMVGAFIWTLANRADSEIEVIRDRAALYQINSEGLVENTYTLKLMNKSQESATYRIAVEGVEGAQLTVKQDIAVAPGEVAVVPAVLAVSPEQMKFPTMTIEFSATHNGSGDKVVRESRLLGPTP